MCFCSEFCLRSWFCFFTLPKCLVIHYDFPDEQRSVRVSTLIDWNDSILNHIRAPPLSSGRAHKRVQVEDANFSTGDNLHPNMKMWAVWEAGLLRTREDGKVHLRVELEPIQRPCTYPPVAKALLD